MNDDTGWRQRQQAMLDRLERNKDEIFRLADMCDERNATIKALRAELAERRTISNAWRNDAEKAEAVIARVRALCETNPFAQEHGALDDDEPVIYRCIPERYILNAIEGEHQ